MNSLQTQLENEKSMNQKNQKKIKEQNDLIKKHEEKRAEFELNLEKLMDQFKYF
jgi:septal ring factor EnvC (AmiA/AmiB activator)